jgi:hypothetical protein
MELNLIYVEFVFMQYYETLNRSVELERKRMWLLT